MDMFRLAKFGGVAPSGMRQVTVQVIGSPYVLSSGYLNAKDLFFAVLSAAGWQLTNFTASVGLFSSSTYLLTFNVLNQYTDQDITDQLFIDLSPYITSPQIRIISSPVRYTDPNAIANADSNSGIEGAVKSFAQGFGSTFGFTSGVSVPLALGALLIFGVLYFNKK